MAGKAASMEPVPEVRAAAEQLTGLTGIDVLADLDEVTAVAVAFVPSCVGVSLTVVVDGDPFTLTSTSESAALLDATQYLDGGPCVETAVSGAEESVPDVLDEQRWQIYGQAAAAVGVRSSLSLPYTGPDGQICGAVNIYAADPDAFRISAPVLAAALSVPVDHLVTNADLSFRTRQYARELPDRLAAKGKTDCAVGVLAGLTGWNVEEANARLRGAAEKAGLPVDRVAEVLVSLYER